MQADPKHCLNQTTPLRGVLIVLLGMSAAGKGHTAHAICQHLLDRGWDTNTIHHLQRDDYLVREGK